jgi:hypothetical protein
METGIEIPHKQFIKFPLKGESSGLKVKKMVIFTEYQLRITASG